MSKISLFLFLAIATILITSPFADSVFAEKNEDKSKAKDDKKYDNIFQALWNAIHELQDKVNSISVNSQTYYVAESSVQITYGGSGNTVNETVLCDTNDIATGGGMSYPSGIPINVFATSFPHVENNIPVGWTMYVDDWSPNGSFATVYVVCLDNP